MVFLKEHFENVYFEKNSADDGEHAKFSSMQQVKDDKTDTSATYYVPILNTFRIAVWIPIKLHLNEQLDLDLHFGYSNACLIR